MPDAFPSDAPGPLAAPGADAGMNDSAWQIEEASLVLVEATLDAMAALGSLSVTRLRVLLAVDRHGPMNLSSLAERLGMSLSAAGRVVDRLAEAGLLSREPAPHSRREIRIQVTPEGCEVLERLRAVRRRRIGQALDRLEPADRATLFRMLLQLTNAADQ
ncbi:MarR family winged helix-turn-helix transcriptional regulator [Nonomuraea angiospora]|uniref:MarR family winged helix-turn-helix transcriptional regulator n=1 Tax=Nonomuraea angiospora TaxID=46172 RepID=UPI0029BAA7EB|nr:MarR family transcriptional regulator [Nonomuraea angiospora]MDX3106108.1 MarR family transcriptional regulator [Nonomuraea angiospora]